LGKAAKQGDRLRALLEGLRVLNEPLEVEAILKVLVEQGCRLFEADRCGVYLFDDGGLLECVASHGLSREYLEAVRGHSPWPSDIEEKPEPLFIPDAPADPELSELKRVIEREGVRSILFLPLFHCKLLGKLVLYHDRPRSWEVEEIELAQALADQAALAVAQSQVHERERRRSEMLAQLQEISTKWLQPHLNLHELLEEVVRAGAELLDTEGGALYLYDERTDKLKLVIGYNLGKDKRGICLRPGEGLSGRVLVSGKPMVVEDYSSWPHRSPQWTDVPITSVAAVPLLYRGRVIGVLNATHLNETRKFTDEDIRLLQLFADQAAAVIEQARLRDLQNKYLEVGTQLLTATELSPIMQGVVEALVDHSPFKVAAISVFSKPAAVDDPDPPEIQEVYMAGLEPKLEERLRQLARERKLIPNRTVVTKGRRIGQAYLITPREIPEITRLGVPTRISPKGKAEWGEHDTLCYLLSWEEGVLGRVTLASPAHGRIPTSEELRPLEVLINMATLALQRTRHLQQVQSYRQRLQEMALHDALTGAYNRHYFTEFIRQEQERAKRHGYPIALVMVDIDDFYEVNDRFGHAEGDRVLSEIAKILMGEVRAHDLVVRYGGDEFLIVMAQTSKEEAEGVMRRLRRRLSSWDSGLAGLRLSISFGVACWDPEGEESLDRVLEQADEFMYLRRYRSRARRARKRQIAAEGKDEH